MFNSNKLHNEFLTAGLPILVTGGDGDHVWQRELTSQEQTLVQSIELSHDPTDHDLNDSLALVLSSEAAIKAIPAWATYTEAQALQWITSNIGTPLANGRTNLPATITLGNIRPVLIGFLDILDKILVAIIAMTKLIVAIRDRNGKRYL